MLIGQGLDIELLNDQIPHGDREKYATHRVIDFLQATRKVSQTAHEHAVFAWLREIITSYKETEEPVPTKDELIGAISRRIDSVGEELSLVVAGDILTDVFGDYTPPRVAARIALDLARKRPPIPSAVEEGDDTDDEDDSEKDDALEPEPVEVDVPQWRIEYEESLAVPVTEPTRVTCKCGADMVPHPVLVGRFRNWDCPACNAVRPVREAQARDLATERKQHAVESGAQLPTGARSHSCIMLVFEKPILQTNTRSSNTLAARNCRD